MHQQELHSYNLPGHGLINYKFLPYTKIAWDYFERHRRIKYLQRTDQLGVLRSIFPGAHHTRYEYVIAQLATVCELCNLSGHQARGFNLSSKLGEKLELEGAGKISKGDALQCLILLNNIGHLSTTFAGERALSELLRTKNDIRRAFTQGLDESVQESFKNSIEGFQSPSLHKYITLFILKRHRKAEKDKKISCFFTKLLYSSMQDDDQFTDIHHLYRSIRKLTYIALDSLYTPVPFNLDLRSIYLSLEYFLDDVFRPESEFQAALSQLDIVLRDSVYMAPQAVIHFSNVTSSTIKSLKESPYRLNTISGLKKLIEPEEDSLDIFVNANENIKAASKLRRKITLNYTIDPKILQFRTVEMETRYREISNPKKSTLGYLIDYSNNLLRVTGIINKGCPVDLSCVEAFKLGKKLGDFELASRVDRTDKIPPDNDNNLHRILNFLTSAVFGWENQYRIQYLSQSFSNIFLERGVSKTIDKINKAIKFYSREGLDPDKINQIKILRDTLNSFPYRGLVLAFIGETEIIKEGKIVTDFDGIAFYLGTDTYRQCIVIEAKNKACGHTQAYRQLKERLEEIDIERFQHDMEHIFSKGAYARIFIRRGKK